MGGADAVAVACPMCHSNLDFRQGALVRRGEAPMPVLFISELVGLALGLDASSLGDVMQNRHQAELAIQFQPLGVHETQTLLA